MDFHTHHPGPPLDRFVEFMWFQKVHDWPCGRETLLPDAGVTIILNLGEPHDLVDEEDGSVRTFRDAWVSGERQVPFVLDSHGQAHLLGIRFRPGGAYPLLQLPMYELTDQVVDLDCVWGAGVHELRERLAEARAPEEVFHLATAELLDRIDCARRETSGIVMAGAGRITSNSAAVSIDEVVTRLGISHTHFSRLFAAQVGVRPKMLQRVVRFQRAVQLEHERPDLAWTAIAQRCGYSDQPHLIREFKSFAGITPVEYRRRTHFPNYVPTDE